MKKTTCLQLTAAFLICLFFSGCQTVPSDQQLIKTTMNSWKQAIIAQDVDAIMANYSDRFSSGEGDKEEMRKFMEGAIDNGAFEDIDINLEGAELVITEEIAEISGVEIIGEDGGKELEFILLKEGKQSWRIVESAGIDSCSYERYSSAYGDDCVQHEGYYRCWDIYVPEGLSGKVPLVIDMHGFTSNPSGQRAMSGFDSLAESERFIVVWPYGLCNSWNSGKTCCGSAVEKDIDDVGFIRKLVKQVAGQYEIDLNRVYLTGLSNGCSMAQRLANEASDIIAAAACMSLYMLVPADAGYTPVSVMELHGTDDEIMDYEPGEFPGAIENFNTWKTMNNCKGSYTVTWSSGDSVAWTYQDCEDGTEVSLVTIDGAGHVPYRGEGTDIDTTRLAWEFMKRFSK